MESFRRPPPTDDPFWAETSWWSAWVPERALSLSVYALFRTNTGICSNRVDVWDADGVRYSRPCWHLPIPDDADAGSFTLPNGFTLERLEPLRRYAMRYVHDDLLSLDLEIEGVHPPHTIGWEGNTTHFDQPTRVTGRIVVRGEELAVDCFAIRDHSWHVRSELTQGHRAGYTYAMSSPDTGFQLIALPETVMAGYVVRDGTMADVVTGTRAVDGDTFKVELTDSLGRRLEARGERVNRFAWQAWAPMFSWFSLVRFTFDDGTVAWGEDQDCYDHTRVSG